MGRDIDNCSSMRRWNFRRNRREYWSPRRTRSDRRLYVTMRCIYGTIFFISAILLSVDEFRISTRVPPNWKYLIGIEATIINYWRWIRNMHTPSVKLVSLPRWILQEFAVLIMRSQHQRILDRTKVDGGKEISGMLEEYRSSRCSPFFLTGIDWSIS